MLGGRDRTQGASSDFCLNGRGLGVLCSKTKQDLRSKQRMKRTSSEADLVFEFALQLRLRGIEFKLEHQFKDCRFDLVIGENNKVTHILEFKKISSKSLGKKSHHQKQILKYKRFGIRFHWIWSHQSFKEALFQITGERRLLVARSKNCIISEDII